MADCKPENTFQVAVLEDGHASVYLPVANWRDVKAVRTVGQYDGAVRVLLADDQVRIYDGPSGAMVDVCVDYLSDEEKQARDKAASDAAAASVKEVHENKIGEAQVEVEYAQELVDNSPPDSDTAEERAQRLADAEAKLAEAQKARDEALSEVETRG